MTDTGFTLWLILVGVATLFAVGLLVDATLRRRRAEDRSEKGLAR